jgi:DNA-binding response OmpR family regulator
MYGKARMRKSSILLVDDDVLILQTIGMALEKENYDVKTAESGEAALELIKKRHFDLLITDLVMDVTDGITLLKEAKGLISEIKVIILTAYGSITSTIDALRLGADDFLLKPCEPEEIFFRVKKCFERMELEKKVKLYENILPVCCVCKKVRDDMVSEPGKGRWVQIEDYLLKKGKVEVTSTYCPECAKKIVQ